MPNQPLPQRKPKQAKKVRTAEQKERRKIRNKNRNLRRRMNYNNASTMQSNSSVYPMPGSSDTGLRKFQKIRAGPDEKLTKEGLCFLKCAFAPPDFATTDVAGVPDDYHGPSLIKKHRLTSSLVMAASTDYYVILSPVPGVAYWIATTVAGTAPTSTVSFTGVNYADFATMFGSFTTTADIVDKFRFVSNHIELIPTVNQMSWTGNIQCWKMPLQLVPRAGGASTGDAWSINGLQGILATNANQYTGPLNFGVYTAAYNTNPTFEFQSIIEEMQTVPATFIGSDWGKMSAPSAFTGFDNNFDSVLIKISGMGTNALNSFIVKTWACVEYQTLPGNLLYEFTSLSPVDPYALKVYREVINNLPVGVAFVDNETFWQRVVSIIKAVSGVGMMIPGPYGAIAGGVHGISSAVGSLLL